MKHESLPTVGQALLIVVALILLEVLIGAALSDLRGALGLDPAQLTALAVLLANGIVLSTLLHLKSTTYRDLFNASGAALLPSLVLLGLPIAATVPLLLCLASALTDLLALLFPLSAWEEQAFEQMSASNLAAVTMVCVLSPVLEEMLFRGVMLRSFLTQYPRPWAIGASALVFGAAHLNIYQFCIAFGMGLYAGWLYDRARSLVPCITLHAVYNLGVTLMDAAERGGASSGPQGFGAAAWAYAAVLALGGGWLQWRLLRPRPA